TAQSIAEFSSCDADRYPHFLASVAAVSGVLRSLTARVPPSIDDPAAVDLIALLKTVRTFRALPRPDAHRLLRWLPMAVADLVHERFQTEPLRGHIGDRRGLGGPPR